MNFKLGDKVRAAKSVFSAATDELPAQDLCAKGDILEIRHVGGNYWAYCVAHPEREPGVMFGVYEDEITDL